MLISKKLPNLLLSSLTIVITAACATAGDQPQWGEQFTRNMISPETGLPGELDPTLAKNIKWKAKLGSSTHSTPIVANGKVFVGTNNDSPRDPKHVGDRGVLMCFDEKDGSLCWQLVVPKLEGDQFLDWPKMGICSPVSVEGNRVYAISSRAEVMCLDIAGMSNGNDGEYKDEGKHMAPTGTPPMEPGKTDADILWLYDMRAELHIHPHDQQHCSILIDGNYLYVNTSNGVDNTHRKIRAPDSPCLIALDKNTGKLLAQDGEMIGPKIFHCTWSSPSIGDVNGQRLLFYGGADGLCYGFEALKQGAPPETPATLKRIWKFDCDPTAPKENPHQFQGNKTTGPSDIIGMPVFYKNRVYVVAGGDTFQGKNQGWLKCIDAGKTGDSTQGGEIWSYELSTHSMATPSIQDGLVYVTDGKGKVHCVDAETGKPYWVHETKSEIWGSTLVADGKVYVGTKRGSFWVLAAGKEKRVISTIELGNGISGTPTAANGVIYVATMTQLFALTK